MRAGDALPASDPDERAAAHGLPASGFNPWLALAYVVFAPFQELIYRGGVQGSLSHFLTAAGGTGWHSGRQHHLFGAHLYVSPG